MVLLWRKCYGSNQTLSDGKQGTLQKIECIPGTVNGDKNLKVGRWQALGGAYCYYSANGHNIAYHYTHREVGLSALIRGFFS